MLVLAICCSPLCQSGRRRCTNSPWITQRLMKMIVNAHQGWYGMNVKFANTDNMVLRIPSQRAQAAPETDAGPKPDDATD